jgi:hypothetical protein
MKAILISPDLINALPFFSHGGPVALVPALGPSLLGHALTRLATAGARHVTVLAADRPEQIRKVLGRGERWGLSIEVVAESRDLSVEEARWKYRAKDATDWLPEGQDVIVADRPLAGEGISPLTEPRRWFETLSAGLPQAHAHRVGVREIAPGVWAGMRSRIDEGAVIQGPCWLGEGVRVAAGAKVGPNALIEDGAFIDRDAEVTESWVGPQTYVGAMTHVHRSFAWGKRLLSYETNSCVDVPDPFLLSELQPSHDLRPRGTALGRVVALALGVLTSPVALLAWWRGVRTKTGFCVARQAVVPLEAGPFSAVREVQYAEFPALRGLWRRWPQIWSIVRGDFAWVGNRPLTPEQAQELTGEFEQLWLAAPVGLVSLADVEGCEDAFDDEARAHASFYAAQAGRQLDNQILRRVFNQRLITLF